MNQIARSDWLLGQDGASICPLGTTHRVPQQKVPEMPYNKSFIDQACSVKKAGYFASLWTETESRSINTQRKNLGNIQPS